MSESSSFSYTEIVVKKNKGGGTVSKHLLLITLCYIFTSIVLTGKPYNEEESVLIQNEMIELAESPITRSEVLITHENYPNIYQLFCTVINQMNISEPRLYLNNTATQANAFASHSLMKMFFEYSPRITITRPLLRILNPETLCAILAHECAHLKHRHIENALIYGILSYIPFFAMKLMYFFNKPEKIVNFLTKHESTIKKATMLNTLLISTPLLLKKSRQDEFDADKTASKVCGAHTYIKVLQIFKEHTIDPKSEMISNLQKLYSEQNNRIRKISLFCKIALLKLLNADFLKQHPSIESRILALQS